jgi:hypothetical protein
MKLKLDDKGAVVVQDGKPVYIDEANGNKEIAFDAPATRTTISRLNDEARQHRERAEAAETKLKGFEGIDDPDKARKALDIVKNLDDKKLIDAGEVEKVKQEAKAAFDEQLRAQEKKFKPVSEERDKFKNELFQERIGGAFKGSKFIADKMAIPADLAQARFGSNFVIEDGKIRAKDTSGNPIFSRARPGEIADFEEALEILVDGYTYRDSVLKGSGASGGGAGGSGGGADGAKTMKRAAFDALGQAERMAAVKAGTTIVD